MVAPPAKPVSIEQLIDLLSERPGAMPIGFTARTNARVRKTDNPNPVAWKTARINGWVNISYAAAVLRERGLPCGPESPLRCGRTWHKAALDIDERVTPFARHPKTGVLYLRVVRPRILEETYATPEGKALDYSSQVQPWIRGRPTPLVKFRTYALGSLLRVTFGGRTYQIRN